MDGKKVAALSVDIFSRGFLWLPEKNLKFDNKAFSELAPVHEENFETYLFGMFSIFFNNFSVDLTDVP